MLGSNQEREYSDFSLFDSSKGAPSLPYIGRLGGGEIAPMGPNGPRGATKGPKWEIKERIRGNPFPLIPYIT